MGPAWAATATQRWPTSQLSNTGEFSPLHNGSGLVTVEANPTPRLALYLNYGGDYAGRDDWGTAGVTTSLGAPSADFCCTAAGSIHLHQLSDGSGLCAGGKWGGHWGAPQQRGRGLRFAPPQQLRLQYQLRSWLQRRWFYRLHTRGLLRRANPRRAGDHRRLLV